MLGGFFDSLFCQTNLISFSEQRANEGYSLVQYFTCLRTELWSHLCLYPPYRELRRDPHSRLLKASHTAEITSPDGLGRDSAAAQRRREPSPGGIQTFPP